MATSLICAQLLVLYAAILPLMRLLGCPVAPQPRVVHADLGGRVRLDCKLQGSWKHIYWQRGDRPDSDSMKNFVGGVSENPLPPTEFMNRSRVDVRNGTLELWDLKLTDSNYYMCLQVSGDACKRSLYQLNVTARYKQPVLMNRSRDDGLLEVTCYTWGGLHLSDVQWLVSAENGSTGSPKLDKMEPPMELQDPTTRLWNLSSTIALNCTQGLRISCVVDNTASEELKIEACPQLRLFPPSVIIAIAVVGVLAISMCMGCLVKVLKRAPSTNGEPEHMDTVL